MLITRELSLKVSRDMWGIQDYYWIDENVTILTKDNKVIEGEIISIDEESVTLTNDNGNTTIWYKNIKNIADTDWLDGEDIRAL